MIEILRKNDSKLEGAFEVLWKLCRTLCRTFVNEQKKALSTKC